LDILELGWQRLILELGSRLTSALAPVYLGLKGVKFARPFRCYGFPLIRRHRSGKITIGADSVFRNWFSSNEMGVERRSFLSARQDGSHVEIGKNFRASGVVICAESSIKIGDNVTVGANSTIIDSDFHPLDPDERVAKPKGGNVAPINIGNKVFIGMHCLIMKGSKLGDGCVVGAGSVVKGTFPPGSIIAGNPAKIVKSIPT